MKIRMESVAVTDLDHALDFYTKVLGFVIKQDKQYDEQTRVVTVVAADERDGAELLLEPSGHHAPTKVYKKALYDEGIPATAFMVEDIEAEHVRLAEKGVAFKSKPSRFHDQTLATFDDTCGNLIMLYQTHS